MEFLTDNHLSMSIVISNLPLNNRDQEKYHSEFEMKHGYWKTLEYTVLILYVLLFYTCKVVNT